MAVQGVMRNVFAEVVPLCRRAQDLIQEVFTAPEQVMTKFVINIYQGQLKVTYYRVPLQYKDCNYHSFVVPFNLHVILVVWSSIDRKWANTFILIML